MRERPLFGCIAAPRGTRPIAVQESEYWRGPGYVQMDICGSHNKTSHNKDGAPYLLKGKELILASENKDSVEVISVPSGKSFNYNSHHVLPLSLQA